MAEIPPRRELIAALDATRVRLSPGSPFHHRQELHRRGVLAALDPGTLLYEYRKLAGEPQPIGVSGGYPGWDTGFLRGHLLGHYLSAASRMSAATGDASLGATVDHVVDVLARCQSRLGGSGYLAAFPETVLDWLEGKARDSGGIVVPYYTIHKVMAGLLDAHRHLGNRQALLVVTRMADHLRRRLAALPAETIERIFRTDLDRNPQNEFGAMGAVLAELADVTGDPAHLDAARLFCRSWFVAPLAAGEDRLGGLHGNCHIAQALGVARTANLTGDADGLRASANFWTLLTTAHSFVIGGDSFREWLDRPGVEAGPSIDGGAALPPTTAEACNTHNMLQLTSALFAREPRVEYADFRERALYNHILASVAPDTGAVTYFTPLHGHFRTYLDGTFCCNGTGLEGTARFNEGIFFHRGDSLWVNLYVPSEVTWDATGLALRQEGNGAAGEPVRISVVGSRGPTEATLHLRIPSWISGTATLAVNGVAHAPPPRAATYVPLRRRWNVGDVVTLSLPAALRLERARDVPSLAAVLFGPIVLAGELGSSGMPGDVDDRDAHLGLAPAAVPAIEHPSCDPADWLRPVAGAPLTYRVHDAGPATGITFRPLHEVHHQRYAVYWELRVRSPPPPAPPRA